LLHGIHLWADLDRDRRVGVSRPNQNDYVFVILVTHPKSYIETTDRRDFGGIPSEWRWGRVLLWKIPEFCSVGEARSKNSIFRVLGYLRLSCAQPTGKFYPKTVVPMESWDSEGVPFASLETVTRLLKDIGPWRVPKSGHVSNTKIEKLHTVTRREIHWFQNAVLFYLWRKITKLSRKNRFRTVASPGACGRLADLIDGRRQYMLLVLFYYAPALNRQGH